MSIPSLCSACWQGKHESHIQDWGIRPGLIGGAYCPCNGDCAKQKDIGNAVIFDRLFGRGKQ